MIENIKCYNNHIMKTIKNCKNCKLSHYWAWVANRLF